MAGKGGKGGGSVAPGVTPVVNAVDEMRSRLYDFVPTATEVIDTEPVIETQPTSEIDTVLDEGRTDIVGDTLTTPDPVDPIDMNDQELEQYKRERVSALSEKLNMAELLPSSYAETSPMNAALQRVKLLMKDLMLL